MEDKIEVYIEDEEYPTDVKKRIKITEIPVFTEEDRMKIKEALDKINKISSFSNVEEITELRNVIGDLVSVLKAKDEKTITVMGKIVENLEATGRSLNEIKIGMDRDVNKRMELLSSTIDDRLFAIDTTLNYLKGLIIDAVQNGDRAKIEAFTENMHERVNSYTTNVNARLDNISLQLTDPLNEMSMRIENLKKEVAAGKKVKPKITISIPTNALEMLAEAKKKIRSKRVQKKNQSEKKRLMNSIEGIEEKTLDLFILSVLGKKTMTMAGIKKDVPVSEGKIRKRINAMAAKDTIKKQRKNRTNVYSVV